MSTGQFRPISVARMESKLSKPPGQKCVCMYVVQRRKKGEKKGIMKKELEEKGYRRTKVPGIKEEVLKPKGIFLLTILY